MADDVRDFERIRMNDGGEVKIWADGLIEILTRSRMTVGFENAKRAAPSPAAPVNPSGGPHIYPCRSCTDPQLCGVNKHCAYAAPAEGRPIATILSNDPYDERDGPWFAQADLEKLRKLPAGTKLYTHPAPPLPASARSSGYATSTRAGCPSPTTPSACARSR